MMKNNIIALLVAGLAITAGGWAMTHNNQEVLIDELSKQKDDIQEKSTEIANLELVIDIKDTDLKAKKKVIDSQKSQIRKQITEYNKLKEYNDTVRKQLKDTRSSLKKEKFYKQLLEVDLSKKQRKWLSKRKR